MNWQYQITTHRTESVRDLLSKTLLIPKHLIFSLRRAQRVLVNGRYLPMNFSVPAGALVTITFEDTDFTPVQPIQRSAGPVAVLYESADVIVINKRSGDKTHPNQPGEADATINYLANYLAPTAVPFMVHRLDQQTSGAIIFGKNPAVVPILVRLIKEKRIKRTYLAWVEGVIKTPSGPIDLPIGRDPADKRKRKVNGTNAQTATTNYQVVERTPTHTLLKVQLMTGRTHQIRVHLAAIGHPIVGDPLYNPNPSGRLRLHSSQVKLIQPFTMESHVIEAPTPTDFNNHM